MKDVWDQHLRDELSTKDAEAALDTMVPNAYVNHVPVLTGSAGVRR
jgi:carboxymethylenebutenolidase